MKQARPAARRTAKPVTKPAAGAAHVVIGMDPHKRSATIEVRNRSEDILGEGRFATDTAGYRDMLAPVFPGRAVGDVVGARAPGP